MRRQTCPGSKKKPWTRKALSNSLLQQKLIARCRCGVRRLLDLRARDIRELLWRSVSSKRPSMPIYLDERLHYLHDLTEGFTRAYGRSLYAIAQAGHMRMAHSA